MENLLKEMSVKDMQGVFGGENETVYDGGTLPEVTVYPTFWQQCGRLLKAILDQGYVNGQNEWQFNHDLGHGL